MCVTFYEYQLKTNQQQSGSKYMKVTIAHFLCDTIKTRKQICSIT